MVAVGLLHQKCDRSQEHPLGCTSRRQAVGILMRAELLSSGAPPKGLGVAIPSRRTRLTSSRMATVTTRLGLRQRPTVQRRRATATRATRRHRHRHQRRQPHHDALRPRHATRPCNLLTTACELRPLPRSIKTSPPASPATTSSARRWSLGCALWLGTRRIASWAAGGRPARSDGPATQTRGRSVRCSSRILRSRASSGRCAVASAEESSAVASLGAGTNIPAAPRNAIEGAAAAAITATTNRVAEVAARRGCVLRTGLRRPRRATSRRGAQSPVGRPRRRHRRPEAAVHAKAVATSLRRGSQGLMVAVVRCSGTSRACNGSSRNSLI
mmetsp:Transcript_114681/g.255849  ORF Transcript_114681/g.255849 Transcript_114681/m.255849 type:complete len:328 (+) Transcript_114681:997-1980(+)